MEMSTKMPGLQIGIARLCAEGDALAKRGGQRHPFIEGITLDLR